MPDSTVFEMKDVALRVSIDQFRLVEGHDSDVAEVINRGIQIPEPVRSLEQLRHARASREIAYLVRYVTNRNLLEEYMTFSKSIMNVNLHYVFCDSLIIDKAYFCGPETNRLTIVRETRFLSITIDPMLIMSTIITSLSELRHFRFQPNHKESADEFKHSPKSHIVRRSYASAVFQRRKQRSLCSIRIICQHLLVKTMYCSERGEHAHSGTNEISFIPEHKKAADAETDHPETTLPYDVGKPSGGCKDPDCRWEGNSDKTPETNDGQDTDLHYSRASDQSSSDLYSSKSRHEASQKYANLPFSLDAVLMGKYQKLDDLPALMTVSERSFDAMYHPFELLEPKRPELDNLDCKQHDPLDSVFPPFETLLPRFLIQQPFLCNAPHLVATIEDRMTYEAFRVGTFLHLHVNYPCCLRLANAGFFYTYEGRTVQCYSCGVRWDDWESNQDFYAEHRRLRPDCLHVNGKDTKNVPIQEHQSEFRSGRDVTGDTDTTSNARKLCENVRQELETVQVMILNAMQFNTLPNSSRPQGGKAMGPIHGSVAQNEKLHQSEAESACASANGRKDHVNAKPNQDALVPHDNTQLNRAASRHQMHSERLHPTNVDSDAEEEESNENQQKSSLNEDKPQDPTPPSSRTTHEQTNLLTATRELPQDSNGASGRGTERTSAASSFGDRPSAAVAAGEDDRLMVSEDLRTVATCDHAEMHSRCPSNRRNAESGKNVTSMEGRNVQKADAVCSEYRMDLSQLTACLGETSPSEENGLSELAMNQTSQTVRSQGEYSAVISSEATVQTSHANGESPHLTLEQQRMANLNMLQLTHDVKSEMTPISNDVMTGDNDAGLFPTREDIEHLSFTQPQQFTNGASNTEDCASPTRQDERPMRNSGSSASASEAAPQHLDRGGSQSQSRTTDAYNTFAANSSVSVSRRSSVDSNLDHNGELQASASGMDHSSAVTNIDPSLKNICHKQNDAATAAMMNGRTHFDTNTGRSLNAQNRAVQPSIGSDYSAKQDDPSASCTIDQGQNDDWCKNGSIHNGMHQFRDEEMKLPNLPHHGRDDASMTTPEQAPLDSQRSDVHSRNSESNVGNDLNSRQMNGYSPLPSMLEHQPGHTDSRGRYSSSRHSGERLPPPERNLLLSGESDAFSPRLSTRLTNTTGNTDHPRFPPTPTIPGSQVQNGSSTELLAAEEPPVTTRSEISPLGQLPTQGSMHPSMHSSLDFNATGIGQPSDSGRNSLHAIYAYPVLEPNRPSVPTAMTPRSNEVQGATSNVSTYDAGKALYPRYVNRRERLRSFSTWPAHLIQDKEDLADAGFFHTGTGDCVRCFYCGLGLKHWEAEDDPFDEHARWRGSCEYLQHYLQEQTTARRLALLSSTPGISNFSWTQSPLVDSQDTPGAVTAQVSGNLAVSTHAAVPTRGYFEAVDWMSSRAARMAQEMGFQEDAIQNAIVALLNTRAGHRAVTPQNLVQAILYIRERHGGGELDTYANNDADSDEDDDDDILVASDSGDEEDPSLHAIRTGEDELNSVVANGFFDGSDVRDPAKDRCLSRAELKILEEENRMLSERLRCKICLENVADVIFRPCSHLVCCIDCASAMRKCPLCRKKIKSAVTRQRST